MTPEFLSAFSRCAMGLVVGPAIRSLIVAGIASLALRCFGTKSSVVRLTVWTGVLYAALAMPFLGPVVPELPLAVPGLIPAKPIRLTPLHSSAGVSLDHAQTLVPRETGRAPSAVPGEPREYWRISWLLLAAGVYGTVAAFFLARLFLGLFLAGRLRRASGPIESPSTLELLAQLGRAADLPRSPQLAESAHVSVPVTLGVRRPWILLPSSWGEWDGEKLRAVLTHELSHVARGDSLTQLLAAFHRSVFWFSPLGWWLERHLAELAEQASDEAALVAVSDRTFYAGVLLDFFGALQGARSRIRWQGVPMATGRQVRRRVDNILSANPSLFRGLKKPAWVGILTLAMPMVYLVAAVRPESRQGVSSIASGTGPLVSTTSNRPSYSLRPPGDAGTTESTGGAQKPASTPAKLSTATPSPTSASGPTPAPDFSSGLTNGTNSYIFICCGGESYMADTDNREVERIKALRVKLGKDIIWIRHNSKPFLIRDEATVRAARELWTRYELQQAKLRTNLAGLGLEQAQLGAMSAESRQRSVNARAEVPDLTEQLKKLVLQVSQLHEGSSSEEFNRAQAELNLLQAKLNELQAKSELDRAGDAQQASIHEQNEKLEAKQKEMMGREMALAEEASHKMAQLIGDAITRGLALPE